MTYRGNFSSNGNTGELGSSSNPFVLNSSSTTDDEETTNNQALDDTVDYFANSIFDDEEDETFNKLQEKVGNDGDLSAKSLLRNGGIRLLVGSFVCYWIIILNLRLHLCWRRKKRN